VRKKQLIRATIKSIARHGLSVTTMATVSKEAGLSQGIINLHFHSKERLLEETLRYVVDEYRSTWNKALENSGDSAVEKLVALVGVDFDSKVCHPDKLAVWFAFWGESRSRPTYRKICAQRDREYRLGLRGFCEHIITEGGYPVDADVIAFGISAMNEGLWLDILLNPTELDRTIAQEVSMAHLRHIFPRHFDL
jgi:TetR/AcrR family transcriptional repressor of bet genes